MRKLITIFAVLALVGLLAFCGKSKEEKQAEEAVKQATQQMQQVAKGLQKMGEQMAKTAEEAKEGKVEKPIDFKVLKEVLPKVDGWQQSNLNGEQATFGAISYARAEADYTNGKINIHVEVADATNVKPMIMGILAAVNMNYQKETETGYEKSFKQGDMVGIEKFDKSSKSGELSVVYKGRYFITITADNLTDPKDMEILKGFLSKIDFSKLQ